MFADPYVRRPPPKSTGRDHFDLRWLRRSGVGRHKAEDVQASLAELTARSIGDAIAKSCPGAQELYFCAGGVRNTDPAKRITLTPAGINAASTDRLRNHRCCVE